MLPHTFHGSMAPLILSLFNKGMHYASAKMSAKTSLLTNIADVGIRR